MNKIKETRNLMENINRLFTERIDVSFDWNKRRAFGDIHKLEQLFSKYFPTGKIEFSKGGMCFFGILPLMDNDETDYDKMESIAKKMEKEIDNENIEIIVHIEDGELNHEEEGKGKSEVIFEIQEKRFPELYESNISDNIEWNEIILHPFSKNIEETVANAFIRKVGTPEHTAINLVNRAKKNGMSRYQNHRGTDFYIKFENNKWYIGK